MNILILGFTKIKYMPYINFYLDNIDKSNNIEVVYWNRDTLQEDLSKYQGISFHEFCLYQEDSDAKINKIKSFVQYRNFVKKILRKKRYDKILVLHTLPGILLLNKLKHYKNNFILDYRDSTFESFCAFKHLVGKLVNWSQITFVSSDAFRKYLPQHSEYKIITSHNILEDSLKHRDDKQKFGVTSDKIRISFWGLIRHEAINKQIISQISKNHLFELHYYGREQETAFRLKNFVSAINATNVFFHGEYIPEERYEMVKHTDIIHNIYHDNNTMLAMGNKYYDGVIFRIPQICMKDSYMGMLCDANGIGKAFNPYDDDFCEQIYKWYSKIDFSDFKIKCDKEMSRILSEYRRGCDIIRNFATEVKD